MPLFVLVFVTLGSIPASAVTHDATLPACHRAALAASSAGSLVWDDDLERSTPGRLVPRPTAAAGIASRVIPAPISRPLAAAPARPVHRRALLRIPATDDDPPQPVV